MQDFGSLLGTGISPVAVRGPFKLFSKSALQKMRLELLGQNIPDCRFKEEEFGSFKRGMFPGCLPPLLRKSNYFLTHQYRYAEFNQDLWKHPTPYIEKCQCWIDFSCRHGNSSSEYTPLSGKDTFEYDFESSWLPICLRLDAKQYGGHNRGRNML